MIAARRPGADAAILTGPSFAADIQTIVSAVGSQLCHLMIPKVDTLADLQQDANAYLVSPCEDVEEVWAEIEARVEEIFAAELGDWCEDESLWPDLHPDIFNEWFDIQLSTVVTDLAAQDLARDAFQPITLN